MTILTLPQSITLTLALIQNLTRTLTVTTSLDRGPNPNPVSCVIAGLSNAYCGYLTTREEYSLQWYEGEG